MFHFYAPAEVSLPARRRFLQQAGLEFGSTFFGPCKLALVVGVKRSIRLTRRLTVATLIHANRV